MARRCTLLTGDAPVARCTALHCNASCRPPTAISTQSHAAAEEVGVGLIRQAHAKMPGLCVYAGVGVKGRRSGGEDVIASQGEWWNPVHS